MMQSGAAEHGLQQKMATHWLKSRRLGALSTGMVSRAGPAAYFRHFAHLVDCLAMVLAFPIAYWIKSSLLPFQLTALQDPDFYFAPTALLALATLFFLRRRGSYEAANLLRLERMIASVGVSVLLAFMVTATALFVFKISYISRLFVGFYGLTAFLLLVLSRLGFRQFAMNMRRSGRGASRVLMIGSGDVAKRLQRALDEEALFGATVVASIEAETLVRQRLGSPEVALPVSISPICDFLRVEAIDEVAVTSMGLSSADLESLIDACDLEGVALHVAAEAFGEGLDLAQPAVVGGQLLLSVNPRRAHSAWGRAFKHAFDLAAAPFLILLTSPVWILAAIAIKLESRGPVFFTQERIGLNKRRFKMLKFRSMAMGSEEMKAQLSDLNEADGPLFKMRKDPRVTRVGYWLRRFDIDELPQLLNVVMGDMSLIGPRPMLPSEITGFEPWQRKRFSMQPGLTGLWQVTNRLGQDFNDGLRADLKYVDTWSVRLDIEILLRTLPAVIRNREAP